MHVPDVPSLRFVGDFDVYHIWWIIRNQSLTREWALPLFHWAQSPPFSVLRCFALPAPKRLRREVQQLWQAPDKSHLIGVTADRWVTTAYLTKCPLVCVWQITIRKNLGEGDANEIKYLPDTFEFFWWTIFSVVHIKYEKIITWAKRIPKKMATPS